MNKSEYIYEDFYSLGTNDYSGIVNYYEKNALYFDNKNTFKDYEDFFCFSQVAGQFVISLENKGRYQKTVKYADKFIDIFNKHFATYEIEKNEFSTYWSILTSKGRALFNLKDFKNSIIVFTSIHQWDLDNDNIKNWLDSAKSRQRNSINKYLYGTGLVLLFVEMIFGNKFTNPKLKLYLSVISFLILSVGLINEYFGDKLAKLIRKK